MESTKEAAGTESIQAVGKGFRAAPEVENFYRFICEEGLRREASVLLKKVYEKMNGKKKKSSRKGRRKKTVQ